MAKVVLLGKIPLVAVGAAKPVVKEIQSAQIILGAIPIDIAIPVAKAAQLVKIILTAIPVEAATPMAKAVQVVKITLEPIQVEAAMVVQLVKIPLVVVEAATLVVRGTQLTKIILVPTLVGAAIPEDKVIHSAQIATLAKVVQLGKIPLIAVEAATLMVKTTRLAKIILAVILVEAATLAKVVQLGKILLVPAVISIKPIMSKISIMFIMSITSTMSIMSMEVAILVGMVMGKTRTGVIIKEGMEKENMVEVIKVLGVATAMDLAKTQVVPKAVEVGMAVTTSQTGRFISGVEK